ncbi:MAG TPA: DMT family transporter [Bacteroidales bacterium]|nr:DMT family transporter [Bacteroidales bacterium]HPS50738.1 DMT family transporter [Bacteroidales bacterium]
MKKIRLPVHFYPLTAMVFWGLSFIWSSYLLKFYEPVTIIFIRLILSASFLFLILRLFFPAEHVARKDLKLILLSSLFNPFLYFLGENYGLKYSTPTISAVIIATIPVFSPVVAYLTFREKLSRLNFVGIAVSFAGIVIMLITKDFTLAADIRGIIFLFGAVLAALFYSVMLKKLTGKYSALLLIAWQNFLGIFLFLPFFLIFEFDSVIHTMPTAGIVGSFLLLSILASSVAFVFFAHSVKLLGISKANIYSNLIPVFTAFFSWILLSESITIRKILGILLVVGGVYLSERTRKR